MLKTIKGLMLSLDLMMYVLTPDEKQTRFDFPKARNIPSNFDNQGTYYQLDPPTLDIRVDKKHWLRGEDTYDEEYILANGVCQPQGTYRWGISFLFLFVYLLLTSIFAILLYAVWLDTFLHARCRRADQFGKLRAAMEISKAIRDELGEEADSLVDKELKRRLAERKAAMTLK